MFYNFSMNKRKREELMFEKVFKLKEKHTNVKTEVIAGLTTFLAMAYILDVYKRQVWYNLNGNAGSKNRRF